MREVEWSVEEERNNICVYAKEKSFPTIPGISTKGPPQINKHV